MQPAKDDDPPKFYRARLFPAFASFECPCCGMKSPYSFELTEDDSGWWIAPEDDRYIQCDECNANIDIGWTGWAGIDNG